MWGPGRGCRLVYASANSGTLNSSFVSALYRSEAGFFGLYMTPGSPLLGASAMRTDLGMTVLSALSPKLFQT